MTTKDYWKGVRDAIDMMQSQINMIEGMCKKEYVLSSITTQKVKVKDRNSRITLTRKTR